jgi:hypothetical protein
LDTTFILLDTWPWKNVEGIADLNYFLVFPYISFSQSFIDDFRVALPPSTNLSILNYLNVSDKPGTFPVMITLLQLTTKNHSLDIQNSQNFFLENLALRQNLAVLNPVIQNSSGFKAKSF